MQTSIVSTMLTLILLAFSLFGSLVPASPVKRTPICPAGDKYFLVKSPGGVPRGTCCAANLAGAVWKEGKPACSLGVQFTTPAHDVLNCPPSGTKRKDLDLAVCIYLPMKRGRVPCGPEQTYYTSKNPTRGIIYGTCCASNTLGAVWRNDKPACTLGSEMIEAALDVNVCTGPSYIAQEWDLDVCIYVPFGDPSNPPQKRSVRPCPVNTGYRLLGEPSGRRAGTCCAPNLAGAVWDGDHPACSLGVKFNTAASNILNCPTDTLLASSGGVEYCIY